MNTNSDKISNFQFDIENSHVCILSNRSSYGPTQSNVNTE